MRRPEKFVKPVSSQGELVLASRKIRIVSCIPRVICFTLMMDLYLLDPPLFLLTN